MPTGTTTPGEGPRRTSSAASAALDGAAHEPPSWSGQFVSSPRGAQLARRLAVRCMGEWGHPPESDASCAVALVVGELAANAVRHGRTPGRDFRLRLALDATASLVRVEVTDAASEKRLPPAPPTSCPEGESGRGLLLVDALSLRWGSTPRRPVGKTVWAEVSVEESSSATPENPRETASRPSRAVLERPADPAEPQDARLRVPSRSREV